MSRYKLPVWKAVKVSYKYYFNNFNRFIKTLPTPLVLLTVLAAMSYALGRALEPQSWDKAALLINFGFGLVSLILPVKWTRMAILNEPPEAFYFRLLVSARSWKILGVFAAYMAFLILTLGLGDLGVELGKRLSIWIPVILIPLIMIVPFYVSLGLALMVPAIASDSGLSLRRIFGLTKKNKLRICAIVFLATLPTLIVGLPLFIMLRRSLDPILSEMLISMLSLFTAQVSAILMSALFMALRKNERTQPTPPGETA